MSSGELPYDIIRPMTASPDSHVPLAERMRPRTFERLYGQDHLLGKGKILAPLIESGRPVSLIFWGPPGSGKTTLAAMLARHFDLPYTFFSAVLSGIKEVKEGMAQSESHRRLYGKPMIIFIDEIHRFNKAQQGAFLPYVERGDIILFGSTTENPSFEVIAPLLSRTKVLVLNPLSAEALGSILEDALADETDGLGRRHLDLITAENVREALQKRIQLYDKSGEEHFNMISALHKSLRNSDVQAALYWLARMLAGGDEPLYIARRLVRFASEDVGLADPQALGITLRAKEAYDFLGSPEGELALAQAVIYLASAPKSNRAYTALGKAMKDVEERPHEPVPLQIRNAVTGLMKDVGYGREYAYAHDSAWATTDMETMPERLKDRVYYEPAGMGFEKDMAKRMAWWAEAKEKLRREKGEKKD